MVVETTAVAAAVAGDDTAGDDTAVAVAHDMAVWGHASLTTLLMGHPHPTPFQDDHFRLSRGWDAQIRNYAKVAHAACC